MMVTLFAKIMLWVWSIPPTDNFINVFIVFAGLETLIEVVFLFWAWMETKVL